MDDDTADGHEDDLLTPDQRHELTIQLARLNENIERQFGLIEVQRAEERRVARHRWQLAVVAALVLAGLQFRWEGIRNEQRRAQCNSGNVVRQEIRDGFDQSFQAIEASTDSERGKAIARQIGSDVHDGLAKAAPIREC